MYLSSCQLSTVVPDLDSLFYNISLADKSPSVDFQTETLLFHFITQESMLYLWVDRSSVTRQEAGSADGTRPENKVKYPPSAACFMTRLFVRAHRSQVPSQ